MTHGGARVGAGRKKSNDMNSTTPGWRSWWGLRQRCTNPKATGYANYGGRGITVCERWTKFENFLADMGPKPSPDHSIDRIDSDGPYAPENCRWATMDVQQANRKKRGEWGGHRSGAGRPRKGAVAAPRPCANCSVLAAEVAQLKRALAAANAQMVRLVTTPEHTTVSGVRRVAEAECIHGAVLGWCRKLGCRPK